MNAELLLSVAVFLLFAIFAAVVVLGSLAIRSLRDIYNELSTWE